MQRNVLILATSLVLSLASQHQAAAPKPEARLTEAELSGLSYDELHAHLVRRQVRLGSGALASLDTRRTSSLDGFYDLCLDPEARGLADGWSGSELRLSCAPGNLWRTAVPSAFNELASNGSLRDYMGWLWYQSVLGPDSLAEPRPGWSWALQFESVNYLALVWLQQLGPATRGSDNTVGGKADSHCHHNDGHGSSDNHLSEESRLGQARCEPIEGPLLLGAHVGGHLPFAVDASELLANRPPGASFRLTVAVSNMLTRDTIPSGRMVDLSEQVGRKWAHFEPDFDFFHYSGIMGSVRAVQLPPLRLASVISSQVSEPKQAWRFNFTIEAPSWVSADSALLELSLSRVAGSGQTLLHVRHRIDELHRRSWHVIELPAETLDRLAVRQWLPAQGRVEHLAELYDVHLRLSWWPEVGRSNLEPHADTVRVRLGRRPSVSPLLQAGQQLQGFGVHHEQLHSGRTMQPAAILKDIYLLKAAGANVLRTSHYPYSADYLAACDEHGLQVVAECAAVGLNWFNSSLKLQLHQQLLLEMMHRDHAHPSIVAWSLANEPQSQLAGAGAYFEALSGYVRGQLGAFSREAGLPLTAAIAQAAEVDRVGHTLDVLMVNRYYGWYEYLGELGAIRRPLLASLRAWARRLPGKPLLVAEFGAEALPGQHDHSPRARTFSEEYQRDYLAEHELVFDELWAGNCQHQPRRNSSDGDDDDAVWVNFRGAMVWNLADFETHDSVSRARGNHKGLLSRTREPKLAFERLGSIYRARYRRPGPQSCTNRPH